DPNLHRRARAQARIEKHERHRLSRQRLRLIVAALKPQRRFEQLLDLLACHADRADHPCTSVAKTNWSTCSSVKHNGGNNLSTFGLLDVPVMIFRSSKCLCTAVAFSLNSIPNRNPSPCTATTRSNSRKRVRRYASTRRTFSSMPSISIASSVAVTAAIASMPPPKVVPRSFSLMCEAIASSTRHAPTGTPLPSAFASVTTSGTTPPPASLPAKNHSPVRPTPVCTSS